MTNTLPDTNPLHDHSQSHDSAWSKAEGFQKESRAIRQVRNLKVAGNVDVVFFTAPTPMLVVAGETLDAIKSVTTTIIDDTLVIDRQGSSVHISGSGSVHIQGSGNRFSFRNFFGGDDCVTSPTLGKALVGVALPFAPDVSVTGAAEIAIHGVRQAALELKVSGAGDVEAFGMVDELTAKISGAGDIKARHLVAKAASLSISGAGDIKATVTESVKARISGCGDAVVRGNPVTRDTRVSGVGKIKFKD